MRKPDVFLIYPTFGDYTMKKLTLSLLSMAALFLTTQAWAGNPPPEPRPEPPVTQEKPPVTQEQPPVAQEEPPVSQEQPPVTQEEPPVTQEEVEPEAAAEEVDIEVVEEAEMEADAEATNNTPVQQSE